MTINAINKTKPAKKHAIANGGILNMINSYGNVANPDQTHKDETARISNANNTI